MSDHAVVAVSVVPTGAALGAEIRGVDLACDLDAVTFRHIEDAFNRHGVIFFRRQICSHARDRCVFDLEI